MMISPRTPPTTPPAIAPLWLLEDFLGAFDVEGEGGGVDDGVTSGSLDVAAFRFKAKMSCSAVKFQPPSGSVRAAFPEELETDL